MYSYVRLSLRNSKHIMQLPCTSNSAQLPPPIQDKKAKDNNNYVIDRFFLRMLKMLLLHDEPHSVHKTWKNWPNPDPSF